jgi:thiol-disulfide isomerase/thioredoxin
MKSVWRILFCCLCFSGLFSQENKPAQWRATVIRQDSQAVVFHLFREAKNGKASFYIKNDQEKIKLDEVVISGDSVFFSMPVFESSFRSRKLPDGSLRGVWTKGTGGATQHWPFWAVPNQPERFFLTNGNANTNITGRWDVSITRPNGTIRKAVAEFVQAGNNLTGTFLTPSGDYRYLEGVVTGDSLKLSTFDGAHAYLFYARIDSREKISGGFFLAGINGKETWTAIKNDTIKPPLQNEPTQMQEGESRLGFSFSDLDGNKVSLNDAKYRDKVIILQIMGSWCPNCMDETKFLSDFYNKNRSRGVEVMALAYEYSADTARSRKSLKKFQKLFDVKYPMLITGATAADEQKTEKTLPQLTPIRSFPTTIFIDRKGNVRRIEGTFFGPGTGKYFEKYKEEFYKLVNELLAG